MKCEEQEKLEHLNNYILSTRRYIDWKRGKPYVFKKEDFNDLINSEALFTRKFDLNVDREIVDMIFKKLYDN